MAYNRRKRKVKKTVVEGRVCIKSTFNNTLVTVTDNDGNAITWASSGKVGYKGSKKKTPFAGGQAAEVAGRAAYDRGLRKVDVYIVGMGASREPAVRSLQAAGLEVTSINDKTPVPHNGCRPPKRRRM